MQVPQPKIYFSTHQHHKPNHIVPNHNVKYLTSFNPIYSNATANRVETFMPQSHMAL